MHDRAASILILLLLIWLCPAGFAALQEEEDIDYPMVRSNPILRQALSVNSPYPDSTDEASLEHKFRETWVDNQVDHFVRQTYRKLSDLKASVQRASSASSELSTENSGKRAQALVTLRQALAKAENQSKDLRTSLSMVLIDLRTKDKFDVKVSRGAQVLGFKVEIQSLSEQTANAERFIRDYFFKPTHVTSLADLKEANMLDYLKRVERIARAIREEL